MTWAQFRHAVESNVLLNKAPNILSINLGGNDLANTSVIKLKNTINRELNYLRAALPDSVLAWIDILPRLTWNGAGVSDQVMDIKQKLINRWGWLRAKKFTKHKLVSVPIDSATPGFFRSDGVHLSDARPRTVWIAFATSS
ncbi:hypothetical protein DPMN_006937 [Dreissena polymorpha]|uniref:SGNH hydrolase-type esterase domain-containing protein n=1 Tax=Dreissena polymorpha TaxID=45954 RepID=A0A9D4RXU9_DREPO|nr:hypothetical protein DPMN_006937 [Dreissena polymorpha]